MSYRNFALFVVQIVWVLRVSDWKDFDFLFKYFTKISQIFNTIISEILYQEKKDEKSLMNSNKS